MTIVTPHTDTDVRNDAPQSTHARATPVKIAHTEIIANTIVMIIAALSLVVVFLTEIAVFLAAVLLTGVTLRVFVG